MAAARRNSEKATCRKCGRTVLLVLGEDGRRYEVDPELLNVFPFESGRAFVFARRAHADLCERYKLEAEKAKFRADQKRKANPGAKRPPNGKREPGQ